MLSLLPKSHRVLRQIAQIVPASEIGTTQNKQLIKELKEFLETFDDGIALAAPQVGVNKRIFVISDKINVDRQVKLKHLVFINPLIRRRSKKKNKLEEGCLSVRYLYGLIKRHDKVTIEAQDETGRKFTHHASGLLAQIFQHEIDHLNGILFIDQATDLHEVKLPPTV